MHILFITVHQIWICLWSKQKKCTTEVYSQNVIGPKTTASWSEHKMHWFSPLFGQCSLGNGHLIFGGFWRIKNVWGIFHWQSLCWLNCFRVWSEPKIQYASKSIYKGKYLKFRCVTFPTIFEATNVYNCTVLFGSLASDGGRAVTAIVGNCNAEAGQVIFFTHHC